MTHKKYTATEEKLPDWVYNLINSLSEEITLLRQKVEQLTNHNIALNQK